MRRNRVGYLGVASRPRRHNQIGHAHRGSICARNARRRVMATRARYGRRTTYGEKTRIAMYCRFRRDRYVVVALPTFRASVTAGTSPSAHTQLCRQTPCAPTAPAAPSNVGRIRCESEREAPVATGVSYSIPAQVFLYGSSPRYCAHSVGVRLRVRREQA